jgi:hypothetical protein
MIFASERNATTTNTSPDRTRSGIDARDYAELLIRAWAIYNAMLANAQLFPAPTPTMAIFLALLTSYEQSQQATLMRTKGATAKRNAAAALLVTAIESETNMVQGLCDANPEQAMVYIDGAGMYAEKTGEHPKEILTATANPATPGVVALDANAKMLTGGSRKRPQFNWQMSPNGGTTIVNLPSTPLHNTEVQNVPLLATSWFRVSVTLGKVTGAWSQWVSVFVH